MLVRTWLTNTDKSATLIDETTDICEYILVDPVLRTTESGIGIADVDDDADVLRNPLLYILEGDKLYFKWHTA